MFTHAGEHKSWLDSRFRSQARAFGARYAALGLTARRGRASVHRFR